MIGLNNKKIGFIVDSSSNIADGQFEDVKVVPLGISVSIDGQTKAFKDGIDFTKENLKDTLSNKKATIKTSQAIMQDMLKVCTEMCKNYDHVVVLPIHKNLSGNINTWKMLKDDFPNLSVVMSCDITISFAWTIQELKEYLKTHECVESELQAFVDNEILPNRFGFLMVEDLSQLAKGGRVSGLKAVLAKLLKIYPIILFDGNGLTNFAKASSNESFFSVVDKYHQEKYGNRPIKKIFLAIPIGFDDMANKYLADFKQHYGDKPYDKTTFPSVVICHTGLKHVAIYFELGK